MKKRSGATVAIAAGCAAVLGMAGCGANAANATKTADGQPLGKVQVLKDARLGQMDKLGWVKDLEKACDCKIQWQETSANSWGQAKGAQLAAGDVADVTIGGYGTGDIAQYSSLFMDLKDHLKDMPNLSKAFKEEPYGQVVSTQADGKIQGTPNIAPTRESNSSNHLFINKAWLDKLGLPVPTTWDEYEAALKAFKTGDPNGNGKQDEIPLDMNKADTGGFGMFSMNVFVTSLGIPLSSSASGTVGMYVKDGVVKNYMQDERWKTTVQFLHRLWEDGVMSKDIFTHDWSQYTGTAKGDQKTAIVGSSVMWTPHDLFGQELGDQYITIPTLKASKDQTEKTVWTFNGDDLKYQANKAVVKANPANLDATLKLVDAFYTPDMSIQMTYGEFGECVKKNGENDYTVLKPADKTKNAGDWMFSHALADGAPVYLSRQMKVTNESDDKETGVGPVDAVYNNDYANMNMNTDILYSNMPITSKQQETLTANATGLVQVSMSNFAKWVTEGGIENEWDAYQQQLKDNKIDEDIKIQQDIYDSYKARMEKLGVDLNTLVGPQH